MSDTDFISLAFIGGMPEENMDPARLEHVMESIRQKSPTGTKVLDEAYARNNGLKIEFMSGISSMGSYIGEKQTIVLNPLYCDEELATTLVHEARHSLQTNCFPKASIKTMVLSNRADEADAMAVETAAACEMGGRAFEAFQEDHKKLSDTYAGVLKASEGNQSAALAETFRSWFDDRKYVAHYDQKILDRASTIAYFDKNVHTPSKKLLESSCPVQKGIPFYMAGDVNFLETERALAVKKSTALSARFAGYVTGDKSIYDFRIAQRDGTTKPLKPLSLKSVIPSWLGNKEKGR